MIIDKNGKLFHKVSVIDILIILVILLCIAGAFIRFSGLLGDNKATPVQIEYVLKVNQIRDKGADAIMKKGELYSSLSDEAYMGTIVNVEKNVNDDYSVLVDGSIVKTSAADRYDVLITVQVDGRQTGTSLYTKDGKRIEIGSLEYIATKWVSAEAEIKSVKITEK